MLEFFKESFEIYVVENNFPINTSDILGLGWELQFKAKINRVIDEYVITAKDRTYALKTSKHPLVPVPKQTISHKVRILSKHPDGFYFVDGLQTIPGVYESKNSEWKLLTCNNTDHVQFVYREDLIVKSRHDFIEKTKEKTVFNNSLSVYSKLFDNKLTVADRQDVLRTFYEITDNKIDSLLCYITNS